MKPFGADRAATTKPVPAFLVVVAVALMALLSLVLNRAQERDVEPFPSVEAFVALDPELAALFGRGIEVGHPRDFKFTSGADDQTGRASLTVELRSAIRRAPVQLQLEKAGGIWRVTQARVQMDDGQWQSLRHLEPARAGPASATAAAPVAEFEKLLTQSGRLHSAGDYPGAVKALDQALALQPTSDEALFRRAFARYRQGDTERALTDVRASLIFNSDRAEACLLLERLLVPRSDFAGIIDAWSHYLARHPEDGEAWIHLANAHRAANQGPETQAALRRACELKVDEGCRRLERQP